MMTFGYDKGWVVFGTWIRIANFIFFKDPSSLQGWDRIFWDYSSPDEFTSSLLSIIENAMPNVDNGDSNKSETTPTTKIGADSLVCAPCDSMIFGVSDPSYGLNTKLGNFNTWKVPKHFNNVWGCGWVFMLWKSTSKISRCGEWCKLMLGLISCSRYHFFISFWQAMVIYLITTKENIFI